MAKRLVAKTGEYQKDGQTKGEYTKIGVVLSNQNGEYMLLDPAVSLAGVLAKQNAMAISKGEQVRDNVMVSIFDDENQGQQQQPQQQQQGGWGQPQQPQQQQQQQQGGWGQPQQPQGQYQGQRG